MTRSFSFTVARSDQQSRRVTEFDPGSKESATHVVLENAGTKRRPFPQHFAVSPFVESQINEVMERFVRYAELHFSETLVMHLPEGMVLSEGFFAASREGNVFSESFRTVGLIERFGLKSEGKDLFSYKAPVTQLDGLVVVLGAQSNNNYFHWLFESVVRSAFIKRVMDRSTVSYLVPNLLPYHKNMLAKFGVKPEQCIVNPGGIVQCEHLILPSRGIGNINTFSKLGTKIIASFGDAVRKARGERPRRRLFISREGCVSRQISNERELTHYLVEEYGFEVLRCEKMSFDAQIELFSAAECIIGPLGAGLTNIVFAPSDCLVIELSPEKRQADCVLFMNLAMMRGQPFASYISPVTGESAERALQKQEFTVEFESFRHMVDGLLTRKS